MTIKYAIEYNGIVYKALTKIESNYFDFFKYMLDDNEIFVNSYTLSEELDEFGMSFYSLNEYGNNNLEQLDQIIVPLYSYLYTSSTWDKFYGKYLKYNKLTPEEIRSVKEDFKSYLDNSKDVDFYYNAVRAIIDNHDLLLVDLSSKQNDVINFSTDFLIVLIFVYIISSIIIAYTSSLVVCKNSKYFREELYRKVLSFSGCDFEQFTKSSLITRSINDVLNVQNASIPLIKNVLVAPLFIIIALFAGYIIAPSLAWIIWVMFGIILLFTFIIMTITNNQFRTIQKHVDKINSLIKDFLNGLFTIRAYNKEYVQINKFDRISKILYNKLIVANSLLQVIGPLLILVVNVLCLLCIWFGKDVILKNELSMGSLLAFMFFSISAIVAFVNLSSSVILFPKAIVSLERIENVLNYKNKVKFVEMSNYKIRDNISIKFTDVSFKYSNSKLPIFKSVNLLLKPNKMYVVVGKTASGKSTLLKLILRFYEATKGDISICNKSISTYSSKQLYSMFAYVPQNLSIFTDTLKNNINISNLSMTDKDIISVIKDSQLSNLIEKNPIGLDLRLASNGDNLSGGQKQRTIIARALLKDAPVLLFDDPFASVDFKTEKLLLKNLKEKYNNKTIIYTTQRLQTINNDDNIIFISNEGRIISSKHSYLHKHNKEYRKLFMNKELYEK